MLKQRQLLLLHTWARMAQSIWTSHRFPGTKVLGLEGGKLVGEALTAAVWRSHSLCNCLLEALIKRQR